MSGAKSGIPVLYSGDEIAQVNDYTYKENLDKVADGISFFADGTVEMDTGAGDTFGACCLHYLLKYGIDGFDEQKLTEMLTFANAAASIITTRKGALRVMPSIAEVEEMIRIKD